MRIIKIKQEKQENGLWGIPFCCSEQEYRKLKLEKLNERINI